MVGTAFRSVLTIATLAFCRADFFFENQAYDNGDYGRYPIEFYQSSSVASPTINLYQYGSECGQDDLYTLLTPRGGDVGMSGPMVLDGKGELVWMNHDYIQPYNLQVQTYRGEQYLTFWAGDDGVRGHGAGMYYMLDSAYHEKYVLGAANGLSGDLHEFKLTEEGTALITVFAIFPADLTSIGGPQRGWIWEAVIQEIEVETNNLLFEWRASEHIPFTDTYRDRYDAGERHEDPFDWFHINSVDKDQRGNYIVSSRHLHSVTCIDGQTGEILWILGGKRNDFQDLSDGRATSFAWQHHARWRDNDTAISLFDNESEDTHPTNRASKGLHIGLDTVDMTAKILGEYVHTESASADTNADRLGHSISQGSFEILPSGNILLGYGYSAQWTVFSASTGDVLCDVHFGPSSQFGAGGVQSYRIAKHPWVGKPDWAPSIALKPNDNTLAMSWLGSTETVRWRIEEGTNGLQKKSDSMDNLQFSLLKVVDKDGFETTTDLQGLQFRYLRVLALDKDSNIIGASDVLDANSIPKTSPEEDQDQHEEQDEGQDESQDQDEVQDEGEDEEEQSESQDQNEVQDEEQDEEQDDTPAENTTEVQDQGEASEVQDQYEEQDQGQGQGSQIQDEEQDQDQDQGSQTQDEEPVDDFEEGKPTESSSESTSVLKIIFFVGIAVVIAASGTMAFWVGALFVRRRIQYRRLQQASDEEAEGKHLYPDPESEYLDDRDSVDGLPLPPDEKSPFAQADTSHRHL